MKKCMLVILSILLCSYAAASSSKYFFDGTREALMKGDARGVSVTKQGELILSPSFLERAKIPDSVIWSIVTDGSNIYIGTGHEGKVYKYAIGPGTIPNVIFDAEEMQAIALALDRNNTLYVATAPNGKIYKMNKEKGFSVFATLEENTIYTMVFDKFDNLIVGTGNEGRVYSVDKGGTAKILYNSAEKSITALKLMEDGSILAGTYPGGILYKLSSDGKSYVLYDSDLEEISSIVTEGTTIYFSAVGTPKPVFAGYGGPIMMPETVVVSSPTDAQQKPDVESQQDNKTQQKQPAPTVMPSFDFKSKRMSIVYKLDKDNYVEELYRSDNSSILSSVMKEKSALVVSLSAINSLVQIENVDNYSLLLKSDGVISAILNDKNKIWFATSNPSALYSTESSFSKKGEFLSQTFDTNGIATWGTMSWIAKNDTSNGIKCFTRSGNTGDPDESWSAWSNAYVNQNGEKIQSAKARFIQYKCELWTNDLNKSPLLKNISLYYLEQNYRPQITSIDLFAGTIYKKIPTMTDDKDENKPVQLPAMPGGASASFFKNTLQMNVPFQKASRQGWYTASWNATDQNGEKLLFNVYYASVDDLNWKPLMENSEDSFFAWDSTMIPDGTYYIKVVASDELSNPAEMALSSFKVSDPFEVDNSQPQITVEATKPVSNGVVINFSVTDKTSVVRAVEYAFDVQKWNTLFPVDLVFDSKSERFELTIKNAKKGLNTIVLRAKDKVNNTATQKITFDVK